MPTKSRKVIKPNAPTHGIRQAELDQCVVRLQTKQPDTKLVKQFKTYYTIFGEHDRLIDEEGNEGENGYPSLDKEVKKKIYAKIAHGARTKYYIRVDATGMFYNPIGLYEERSNKSRYVNNFVFAEVNQNIFVKYAKFLKTRNDGYLRQARREGM
jgi:hypothetical protein